MTGQQTAWNAAVIGLGFIGAGDPVSGDAIGQKVADLDGTHASALASHSRVRLVAGSSRDEGRRKRFEERQQGCRAYADWREMLSVEKPDIVSVATNSPYHAEITVGCAEAGVRAVLCEKPIATSLSDAERAIEACRRRETILAVNHSRRWHPLWRAVRDAIRGGAIGDVYEAAVHWPTGRMGNIGTHMFDALRLVLGREARAVSGVLDPTVPRDCRGEQYHDPGGWGVIDFGGGVRAFVNAPATARLPLAVRVTGSEGQVTIRDQEAVIEPCLGSPRRVAAPDDGSNSLACAVEDLVRCLTSGGSPMSTGEDGQAALEIIIGFHVSDRLRGQWVPLPVTGDDRKINVRVG